MRTSSKLPNPDAIYGISSAFMFIMFSMQKVVMSIRTPAVALTLLLAALGLAACGSSSSGSGGGSHVTLVAYSTPQGAYSKS